MPKVDVELRVATKQPCGGHSLLRRTRAGRRRLRIPRFRQLTGTQSQRAAIVLAVRPVIREMLPALEAVGLEVSAIALLPTLTGSYGEPLQARVNAGVHVIRLAHMVDGILRRPEELAGVLAEELLGLYRDAAAVTIVRQTPAIIIPPKVLVSAEGVATRKNGRAEPVSPQHTLVKDDAEGKLVGFRANPLGSSTDGHGA